MPGLYANVDLANTEQEVDKLIIRSSEKELESQAKNTSDICELFHNACEQSKAVIACSVEKLHRQVNVGSNKFEAYYELEKLRWQAQAPKEYNWRTLRPQAEIELLGSEEHIRSGLQLHYACLSLDGIGLDHYGECKIELLDNMISGRASCFEGNTALIYFQEHGFANRLRSSWGNRALIAYALCSELITSTTTSSDFPNVLLSSSQDGLNDRYIEVHIMGPLSVRSCNRVWIDSRKHSRDQKLFARIITERFNKYNITVHQYS